MVVKAMWWSLDSRLTDLGWMKKISEIQLEEIGFHFNMRYFEDTVTVGEFG
ncbi:hypothetical protein F2Q69_00037146 [Brassica cretica]|uniref:Uncharacterized protein n=1 Tax=Brassica cretica TaxID=69181 RepID=A0A8S9SH50_BRACR|nr:hypothetical protein F2Q69_00037146 [Brassica cretica]